MEIILVIVCILVCTALGFKMGCDKTRNAADSFMKECGLYAIFHGLGRGYIRNFEIGKMEIREDKFEEFKSLMAETKGISDFQVIGKTK